MCIFKLSKIDIYVSYLFIAIRLFFVWLVCGFFVLFFNFSEHDITVLENCTETRIFPTMKVEKNLFLFINLLVFNIKFSGYLLFSMLYQYVLDFIFYIYALTVTVVEWKHSFIDSSLSVAVLETSEFLCFYFHF